MDTAAINTAADYIRTKAPQDWDVLIILGSGLGPLALEVQNPIFVPYGDIPGFPVSTAPGHAGRFVIGQLEGVSVGVMQGRMHFYEGHPVAQTTLPIRVAKAMGAKTMIVTNAAGGINRNFNVGDVMIITDHINFLGMAGNNPLVGPNDEAVGPRFPQLTDAYNLELRNQALEVAKNAGITLQQGVFVCQSGPFYETPAELRFLRCIGADACGMSTANEVIVARHAGLTVLGLSSITNVARLSSDEGEPPSHEEVLEAAVVVGPKLLTVVKGVLAKMAK
eukprot:TRINITY_DN11377_c0_g1_i1.p1 TRINITY_DN11377_c0_g1~~TRINITY_DN11377_c0_g1_i1.p1  ORF type:complete len:294 (+),score=66.74 TRINITY_DN11377_c0_g1_i1:46-882(+)